MTLLVWNCNMAFRRKFTDAFPVRPDISILSECECPERLCESLNVPPSQIVWTGDSHHKGLAVIAHDARYSMRLLADRHTETIRHALPVEVQGPISFTLLALWAMPCAEIWHQRYIGQVWAAINHYEDLLACPAMVAGDFNGNVIWDKTSGRRATFRQVADFLAERNLRSAYHSRTGEPFGSELEPTLYMYRRLEHVYHIDYLFLSPALEQRLTAFSVGPRDPWLTMSDHVQLIAAFDEDTLDSPQRRT